MCELEPMRVANAEHDRIKRDAASIRKAASVVKNDRVSFALWNVLSMQGQFQRGLFIEGVTTAEVKREVG